MAEQRAVGDDPGASRPAPPIASQARWGLIAAVAGIVSGLVRFKVTAVALGPKGVGIAAEVTQVATLLLIPASFISGATFVATMARCRTEADRQATYDTGYAMILLYGLPAIAAAGLVSLFVVPGGDAQNLVLTILAATTLVATCVVGIRAAVLLTAGDVRTYALASIASALWTGLCVALATVKYGIVGQFAGAVASAAASTLAFRLVLQRTHPGLRASFRPQLSSRIAREIATIGMTSLVAGLTTQAALSSIRLALAGHGGDEANGQFQAAWAIGSTYLAMIHQALGNVVFPRYASAEAADLGRHVEDALSFVMRYTPPVILMGIAVREPVMTILYSDEFELGASAVGFQMAGDLAKSYAWAVAGPLLVRGHTRVFLVTESIAAVLLGGLAVALIQGLGVEGASVGYAVAYLAYAVVAREALRRTCEVRTGRAGFFLMIAFTVCCVPLVALSNVYGELKWCMGAVAAAWAAWVLYRHQPLGKAPGPAPSELTP